jgi:hypothetical protein
MNLTTKAALTSLPIFTILIIMLVLRWASAGRVIHENHRYNDLESGD